MAKEKAASTDVAATEAKLPVAVANPFEGTGIKANAGFEEVDSSDIIIPFLRALQPLSPQLDESKPKYLPDAKKGQLVITGLNKLFDGKEGVYFIPVYYQKIWNQWKLRDQGGGLVAVHKNNTLMSETIRDDKGRDILPDGTQLVQHSNLYAVLVDTVNKEMTPVMISAATTQLKYMKGLITLLQSFQKRGFPMMANFCKVGTILETNEKGSWYSFQFERLGLLQEIDEQLGMGGWLTAPETIQNLVDFHKNCVAGMVKADKDEEEFDPVTGEVKTNTDAF